MDAIFNKLYGAPVAGKAGNVAFDGTDKTVTLESGMYAFYATAECFIAVGVAATTDANKMPLPMGQLIVLTPGPIGTVPVLHVTQMTGAGTLYFAKMDKVG